MSTHSQSAKRFVADAERLAWHDRALYAVREKRDRMMATVPEWESLRRLSSELKLHTLSHLGDYLCEFERNATASTQLLPAIDGTLFSAQFSHIFGGGYAAGYYGYKWAEVLDADAFSLFQEKGIFDRETAASFRKNILEKGDTEDPMSLYVRFRGREPQIDALMQRDGIK